MTPGVAPPGRGDEPLGHDEPGGQRGQRRRRGGRPGAGRPSRTLRVGGRATRALGPAEGDQADAGRASGRRRPAARGWPPWSRPSAAGAPIDRLASTTKRTRCRAAACADLVAEVGRADDERAAVDAGPAPTCQGAAARRVASIDGSTDRDLRDGRPHEDARDGPSAVRRPRRPGRPTRRAPRRPGRPARERLAARRAGSTRRSSDVARRPAGSSRRSAEAFAAAAVRVGVELAVGDGLGRSGGGGSSSGGRGGGGGAGRPGRGPAVGQGEFGDGVHVGRA